ncbi:MAG: hypothetical protein C4337_10315 [Armatimonadota bacterium]
MGFMTPQERADLVAFLLALSDESAKPEIPKRVPSGFPVVPRLVPNLPARLDIDSPELRRIQALHQQRPSRPTKPIDRRASRSQTPSPRVGEARPGESIQEAVDRVGRNGIVRVYPGVYHENVLVIHHGVRIEGIIQNGKRPVLDGKNTLADGISAMGKVYRNNTPNFADPNAIVSNVLKGTGIMLLAADRTEVYENAVVGNDSFGIMVVSLLNLFPRGTNLDVDPFPDYNRIYNNTLRDNGKNPDLRVARYGSCGRPPGGYVGVGQRMEPAWCKEFSHAVAAD